MLYGLGKMAGTKCFTFVFDETLGYLLGSLAGCSSDQPACSAYTYAIQYRGGNLTEDLLDTLRVGGALRCGGYVLLLRNVSHVIQFLEVGHTLRLVNTRAKFLIWYQGNDKVFEGNDLWDKIINVIFFHSKPKKRQRGLLFTVRQLKWPIVANSTESRLRVLEFWGDSSEDNNDQQVWFYDKTLDLKNITLRIVVVEHPPGVIKFTNAWGQVEYGGTEIRILENLSKTMKFSYELQDADPTTKWGGKTSPNETGDGEREFYGAVSRLIYGEADIGIGSWFILKHYLDHIDMSIPLEVACTSLLSPNPLPLPRYLAMILPFRTELWLVVIVTVLIAGPVFIIGFAAPRYQLMRERPHFRVQQACLTSIRIMSQVALHVWPNFWPMRLFVVWYWFFWFLLSSGYRAAMVSFLTIPLYEKTIDSLKDLADSKVQLGGWGRELQRIFFQHLEVNNDMKMGKELTKRYEVLTNLDDGISRVAAGDFALYENVRFLKFIRMTRNLSKVGSPTMRIMNQCVVPVHLGFAYQKNSALTLTINRYIRSFQESGLVKRWASRLVTLTRQHRRNNQESNDEPHPSGGGGDNDISESDSGDKGSRTQRVLRLQDLQGAVYVLFLGLALSLVTFGIELVYQRTRTRKLNLAQQDAQIMIKKSTRLIVAGALEPKYKVLDVRVRRPVKRKRHLCGPKQAPFPYVD